MRKEVRYKISYNEFMNIKNILDLTMNIDENSNSNGEYIIKNMYFDNCYKEIKNKKEASINSVKKYRIRMYNNDQNAIFLERKSNENGFIEKIKQKITKKDVLKILERKL